MIYGNPMEKFNFNQFLSQHPVEWKPFLEEAVHTQQFSEFIDSRLFEVGRDPG